MPLFCLTAWEKTQKEIKDLILFKVFADEPNSFSRTPRVFSEPHDCCVLLEQSAVSLQLILMQLTTGLIPNLVLLTCPNHETATAILYYSSL